MAVATGMVSKYFSRISVTFQEKQQVSSVAGAGRRFRVKGDSPFLHPFPA